MLKKAIIKGIIVVMAIVTLAMAMPETVMAKENYSNAVTIAKKYGKKKKAKRIEEKINRKYGKTKYIKGGENSWEKLDHRKGKSYYYVTYELGKVVDGKGNGKSLYFKAPYNYISYRGISGAKKGKYVLTYFVWCKTCNECDDMIARYDLVL